MMKRGFSLIELLVVVAIIAILVGVATPYYADYVRESKRAKALQDLDVLKQAVVLYNSQEDLPYMGMLSTTTTKLVPILGENDFNGLQGRYLTYIPVDPWGKNYKLDPYACFVYSDGPDSRVTTDDIKDYYIKDLAMLRIEWEDTNNNRSMDDNDNLYFHFNKPLYCSGMSTNHFDVYENNEVISSITLDIDYVPPAEYSHLTASSSTLIAQVRSNKVKLGVHAIAFRDDLEVLNKYMEVKVDRPNSTSDDLRTLVEPNTGNPYRYAIRTNPIKITPK